MKTSDFIQRLKSLSQASKRSQEELKVKIDALQDEAKEKRAIMEKAEAASAAAELEYAKQKDFTRSSRTFTRSGRTFTGFGCYQIWCHPWLKKGFLVRASAPTSPDIELGRAVPD